MSKARIEYRLTRSAPRTLWAWRVGTRRAIRRSALGLREHLRETYPRALVFVDGRRVQRA